MTKESRVSADKKYAVECRTTGSRPDAEITWWKANRQIKNGVQNVSMRLNSRHLFIIIEAKVCKMKK